jgi:hypothetical protein
VELKNKVMEDAMNNLWKMIGKGMLLLTSIHATQAVAVPIFSFTEYSGFTDDVAAAVYSDLVVGDVSLVPAAEPIYSAMSWQGGRTPQSSLELYSVNSPAALMADTWTTISTMTHNNVTIPGAFSWYGQDIWGRFIVTDADGGTNVVLDSDSVITMGLTETKNKKTCAPPNPIGTVCDDYFTLTAGLEDLFFTANDGSEWQATFRFANPVNAEQIENVVFTGEGMTSSVDVQVLVTSLDSAASISRISSIPEPATLGILCLGLLGLAMAQSGKLGACQAITGGRQNER